MFLRLHLHDDIPSFIQGAYWKIQMYFSLIELSKLGCEPAFILLLLDLPEIFLTIPPSEM